MLDAPVRVCVRAARASHLNWPMSAARPDKHGGRGPRGRARMHWHVERATDVVYELHDDSPVEEEKKVHEPNR